MIEVDKDLYNYFYTMTANRYPDRNQSEVIETTKKIYVGFLNFCIEKTKSEVSSNIHTEDLKPLISKIFNRDDTYSLLSEYVNSNMEASEL